MAIMMVEAESTPETLKLLADSGSGAVAPTEDTVAEGLEAAKPFIKILCEAQQRLAAESAEAEGTVHAEYPVFVDYTEDVYDAVAREVSDELAKALTIAGKHDREAETDRVKALAQEKLAEQFEGREKEISAAFRSLTKKLVRERIIRDGVRIDGRGLTDIRPLSAHDARAAPGARLRAVRAGRDPDPGRDHAEHAPDGADDRHAQPRADQALHAQLQHAALLDR